MCLFCRKEFFYFTGNKHTKGKFCSCACSGKYRREQTIEKILKNDGTSFIYDRTLRIYLLETRPHECVICKLKAWKGKDVPLVMDHINGNPYDGRLENLRLICPNCDAQLPTYKNRNRGKGRNLRKDSRKQVRGSIPLSSSKS